MPARGRGTATAGTAVWASASGADSQVLLDLRDRPVGLVEELGVDLVPAAELVDREQALGSRELLRIDQLRVDRAVAVLCPDLLTGVRPDEIKELLRLCGRVLGHG